MTRIQIAINDLGIQNMRNGTDNPITYDVLIWGSAKTLIKTEKQVIKLINHSYSLNKSNVTAFKQYTNGNESFYYAHVILNDEKVLYNDELMEDLSIPENKPTLFNLYPRKNIIRMCKANYVKEGFFATVRDENNVYLRDSCNSHIPYETLVKRNTAEIDSFHDSYFDDVLFATMTDNQLESFIQDLSTPLKANRLYLNGYDTEMLTRYQEYMTTDTSISNYSVIDNSGKSTSYPKSLFVDKWHDLVPIVRWTNIYKMSDKELHNYLSGKYVFCKTKKQESNSIKYGVAYNIRTAFKNVNIPYDNYVTLVIEDEEHKKDITLANPYDANDFWIVDKKEIDTFEIIENKRIIGKYCTIKNESDKHFYSINEICKIVTDDQFKLDDLNCGGIRLVNSRKDLIINEEDNSFPKR